MASCLLTLGPWIVLYGTILVLLCQVLEMNLGQIFFDSNLFSRRMLKNAVLGRSWDIPLLLFLDRREYLATVQGSTPTHRGRRAASSMKQASQLSSPESRISRRGYQLLFLGIIHEVLFVALVVGPLSYIKVLTPSETRSIRMNHFNPFVLNTFIGEEESMLQGIWASIVPPMWNGMQSEGNKPSLLSLMVSVAGPILPCRIGGNRRTSDVFDHNPRPQMANILRTVKHYRGSPSLRLPYLLKGNEKN